MIKFDAKWLRILLSFVAKNDIRFYLQGIRVEPHKDGGATLVATNGHMLVAIRDVEALCSEPATLRIDVSCKKYAGVLGRKTAVNEVHYNPNTDRLIITGAYGDEIYVQPGKGSYGEDKCTYPQWRKALPDFGNLKIGLESMVKPSLLKAICEVSEKIKWSGIRFWQSHPDQPIVIQFPDMPEALAILMPMRDSPTGADFENWIGKFKEIKGG